MWSAICHTRPIVSPGVLDTDWWPGTGVNLGMWVSSSRCCPAVQFAMLAQLWLMSWQQGDTVSVRTGVPSDSCFLVVRDGVRDVVLGEVLLLDWIVTAKSDETVVFRPADGSWLCNDTRDGYDESQGRRNHLAFTFAGDPAESLLRSSLIYTPASSSFSPSSTRVCWMQTVLCRNIVFLRPPQPATCRSTVHHWLY